MLNCKRKRKDISILPLRLPLSYAIPFMVSKIICNIYILLCNCDWAFHRFVRGLIPKRERSPHLPHCDYVNIMHCGDKQ